MCLCLNFAENVGLHFLCLPNETSNETDSQLESAFCFPTAIPANIFGSDFQIALSAVQHSSLFIY